MKSMMLCGEQGGSSEGHRPPGCPLETDDALLVSLGVLYLQKILVTWR